MTPPLENHHVCTACGQSYPVTALVCTCGGREFVPVELETGGTSMRVTNYDGVPLFEARHVPQPGGTYSNTLSSSSAPTGDSRYPKPGATDPAGNSSTTGPS